MNFSGMSHLLTKDLLDLAIKSNCSIFLEEMWENSKKFGGYKSNKNASKLSFINYLYPMLENKKIEMASEAIKYWSEVFREEGIFDILLEYKEEELLM